MVKNTEINLSTVSRDLKKSASEAVVIGVGQGTDGPVLLDNPLTAKSAEALTESLKALGVTGAADQLVRLPGLPETGAGILALAGVGKVAAGEPLAGEALRRAAGSAVAADSAICRARPGDALSRTQLSPSAATASES